MKTNDYFEKTGTEDEIENSMVENIACNKANAALLVSIIHNNEGLLSDDECFIKKTSYPLEDKSSDTGVFGFMFFHQTYHINIKYTTLALICLIFDITMSQGIASFLLAIFGVDYSLVKLTDMEKCIAYKLKEARALSLTELKNSCKCSFTYNNSKCGNLNDDGNCNKWSDSEMIDKAVESLISKKVIKLKGNKYELVL